MACGTGDSATAVLRGRTRRHSPQFNCPTADSQSVRISDPYSLPGCDAATLLLPSDRNRVTVRFMHDRRSIRRCNQALASLL